MANFDSYSEYLSKRLLGHTFLSSVYSPTSAWLGLITTLASDGNFYTEVPGSVGGNGYARKATTWTFYNSAVTPDAFYVGTAADIVFSNATTPWAGAAWVGLFDSSTAGNLLYYGPIKDLADNSVVSTLYPGDELTFPTDETFIYFEGGFPNEYGFSAHLVNKLHQLTLIGSTYTGPTTMWVGLGTATSNHAALTEVSTNTGYARQVLVCQLTTPAWRIVNSAQIDFTAASTTWGTITHVGLFDASAIGGGRLLYWTAVGSAQTVATSDTVRIAVNSLTVRIK